MSDYFVVNKKGEIINHGTCPAGDIKLQGLGKDIAVEGSCDPVTDIYDHKKKKLIKRKKRDRDARLMGKVRIERNQLLTISGHELAELMLPDSFPKLNAKQKQAKIDAWVSYRVKLRDITDQDPNNIVWPEMPL